MLLADPKFRLVEAQIKFSQLQKREQEESLLQEKIFLQHREEKPEDYRTGTGVPGSNCI